MERARIVIRGHKTKRRVIPLFDELRPYLEQAFADAEDRAVHVVTRCRSSNANLRTQFARILDGAKLPIWPRPFHNLRATRETELANEFPIHVVCEWMGTARTWPGSTTSR